MRPEWSNKGGSGNVATGYNALWANLFGNNNTATGSEALEFNTSGHYNTASGSNSLESNTTGSNNTAEGVSSLFANTTGENNVATGSGALRFNTMGSDNIVLGNHAGYYVTTGNYNIEIGNPGLAGDTSTIRIGSSGNQTTTYVAGITSSRVTGSAVYISSTGQLGVLASSERYKTDIEPMGASTMRLQKLRPVTFHLKTDPQREIQYGLIAEEVAKVYPELVIRNGAGRIEGVRYEELTPMLLNEVQQQRQELREVRRQLVGRDGSGVARP